MSEPTPAQQDTVPGGPGMPPMNKKEAKAQAAAAKAYAKSQRNWFARHKILTGLGALILLIIIISVANGGGGSTGTTTASTGGAAAPAKAAGLNQPVRDGGFEFTVKSFTCGKSEIGTAPLSKKAQGQFCLLNMHVSNIGNDAKTLDGSSQLAFDAQGRKFSADSAAAMYLGDQAQTFLNDINPGNAVDGTVVFDVPKNVKITQLELHDSPFSGGAKVNVG